MTAQIPILRRPIEIPGETELARLVARSRLIGADPTLVVHGGGNTSSKVREVDHLGRERTVLRIKGSGTDLRTIGPDGFPGLYLDELLPLRARPAMTDEEMVAYLARCMVEPGSRRPSIETLLHAFLPAPYVDHVHADAICALTNNPDPEHHVRQALGDTVAVVPYLRPGFDLSRQVANLASRRAVVLAKHGLVTWGETPDASYGLTLELVEQARAYLAVHTSGPPPTNVPALDDADGDALIVALRSRLSRERRSVLHIDRTQRALADRPDVDQVATAARATPDHILRIGTASAVVRGAAEIESVVDAYERDYRAYFDRHRDRLPPGIAMLNPLPRVVLVPGLGCLAAGPDARTARANAEIAFRSHTVTAAVLDAFGEVSWLDEVEKFAFDYWPLELAKLASAAPPAEFAGHVVIVTGAASPLGRSVVARLAGAGANLVLANDQRAASEIAATLPPTAIAPITIVAPVGAADPCEFMVQSTVAAFGGVDALVAVGPPPPGMVACLGTMFDWQGLGGIIVVIETEGAGENIAGLQTAARSIRSNAVRPEPGAAPAAVAEAVAFLASARAGRTTGAVLPVAGASNDP